jgi:RHS repeat-associated protein
VAVEGGVVKYRKNGALLYTSTVTPTYPLLVDSALYATGDTLSNVVVTSSASGAAAALPGIQSVSWQNVVGASVAGNSLTKTAATGWGNAGASSAQSITAGDGYMELTVSDTTTYRFCGLSNGNSNADYTDVDFAIHPVPGGTIYIYEGGISRGTFGSSTVGDVLRVAVEGGVVKYRKNGALLYTSTITPTYPLLVDSALYATGDTLSNVVVTSSASGAAKVQWLVPDHLGTPRIIIDQTGNLANVKRHDYLPFGEELFAGTGGRTVWQGYTGGDGVRQQFTAKERDTETGLDYFLARYYSATQGRFTSADTFGGSSSNPQTLNLYAYTNGNPLRFVDPTGHFADESPHGGPTPKSKGGGGCDLPGSGTAGCLWMGQDPQKPSPKPATPIGPQGEIPGDGDLIVSNISGAKFPGTPDENPGQTPLERYAFNPKQSALEVIDWASKGIRRVGYAITPDYGFANFGVPLVASGSLQYSKDGNWYFSFAGPTAGAKNFKVGGQVGIAYFATTEMNPDQRDAAIQGPGINVTTPFTPVGAYFPSSGRPAVTLGWPFSAGVNGSKTWRIPQ